MSGPRTGISATVGLLALGLVACAPTADVDESDEDVGVAEQAIINGTQSTWNSAVVGIKTTFENGLIERCTATMITRFDLLTAAHCVMHNSSSGAAVPLRRVDVAFGKNWNDKLVLANWYTIHPACDVDGCVFVNDLAVLSFNNPVDGVAPAPIPSFDMPEGTFIGDGVVMVGFGAASTDRRTGAGVKRWAYAHIVDNTGDELLVEGDNGASQCDGDSGGPILRWNGSAWQIVGVLAGGGCGSGLMHAAMPTALRQFIEDSIILGSASWP